MHDHPDLFRVRHFKFIIPRSHSHSPYYEYLISLLFEWLPPHSLSHPPEEEFDRVPQSYPQGETAQASLEEVQKVLKLMDIEGMPNLPAPRPRHGARSLWGGSDYILPYAGKDIPRFLRKALHNAVPLPAKLPVVYIHQPE